MAKATTKSKDKHKGVNFQKVSICTNENAESDDREKKAPRKEPPETQTKDAPGKEHIILLTPDQMIRVRTEYYKLVDKTLYSGDVIKERVKWNISTLKMDWGRKFYHYYPQIKKYDDFILRPDHISYSREVGSCYNLYDPLPYNPEPGECKNILEMVNHIFDEQYEIGLDYMQLLYLRPLQKLPILLLVSTERNTGKSTWLNFLKLIYGSNMTFINSDDMRSTFNSDWLSKHIVAIDEALLNRREDSERFKQLSTATTSKIEAKGVDRIEVQIIAKFILCSNDELAPVIIDQGETRYWVRKIKPLQIDKKDHINDLKQEIPAFLYFLLNRQLKTTDDTRQRGRMWFKPEEIETDALKKIMSFNRSPLEQEMAQIIADIFDILRVNEINTYQFTATDLTLLLREYYPLAKKSDVIRILKEKWKLKPSCIPTTYKRYKFFLSSGTFDKFLSDSPNGRFYSLNINEPPQIISEFVS